MDQTATDDRLYIAAGPGIVEAVRRYVAHTLAADDRPERAAEDPDPLAAELGEDQPVTAPPDLVEALSFDLSPMRPWEWLQMDIAWWNQLVTMRRLFDDEVAERKRQLAASAALQDELRQR